MISFDGCTFVKNEFKGQALADMVVSVWRDSAGRQILVKNYVVHAGGSMIIHDHNSKRRPDDAVVYDGRVITDQIEALPHEEKEAFFYFFDKTALMLPELRRFYYGGNAVQGKNVSAKAAEPPKKTVEWEGEKFLSFGPETLLGSAYVNEALKYKTDTPEGAVTKAVLRAAEGIDFIKPDGEPIDEDEVMNAVAESGLVSKLVDWEDWPYWAKRQNEDRFGRPVRNPYLIVDTEDFINDMVHDGEIMLVSYCRHGQTKLALIEYDYISGLFDEYFC